LSDVRAKLSQVEADLDRSRKEIDEAKMVSSLTTAATTVSSNKSDDGWCLNGEEVKLNELEEKTISTDSDAIIAEKDKEIEQLKLQVGLRQFVF
jgi:hypothetical protein